MGEPLADEIMKSIWTTAIFDFQSISFDIKGFDSLTFKTLFQIIRKKHKNTGESKSGFDYMEMKITNIKIPYARSSSYPATDDLILRGYSNSKRVINIVMEGNACTIFVVFHFKKIIELFIQEVSHIKHAYESPESFTVSRSDGISPEKIAVNDSSSSAEPMVSEDPNKKSPNASPNNSPNYQSDSDGLPSPTDHMVHGVDILWKEGEECLARWSDGIWYSATIMKIVDKCITNHQANPMVS